MVPGYSVVWLREDLNGGWRRILTKFNLNNLHYDGNSAPPSAAAALDSIQDLVAVCQAEGVEVLDPPKKATSFTKLVKEFENKGLLPSAGPQVEVLHTPDVVNPLLAAHHSAVSHMFLPSVI